jgi:hypothetical protein
MNTQEYIQELIPAPNTDQPNYTAWLAANLQTYVDDQTALGLLPADFNIDIAVGDQLDVLGVILGVSRTVPFDFGGGISPVLADPIYRIVLKARIILDLWNGTKDQIYDFWQNFLPEYPVLIQDNLDMSMSVLIFGVPADTGGVVSFGWDTDTADIKGWDEGYWGPFENTLRQLIENGYFTPKPAGVSVAYSFADSPVFAWDIENDLFKGWDQADWAYFE